MAKQIICECDVDWWHNVLDATELQKLLDDDYRVICATPIVKRNGETLGIVYILEKNEVIE